MQRLKEGQRDLHLFATELEILVSRVCVNKDSVCKDHNENGVKLQLKIEYKRNDSRRTKTPSNLFTV
jgi:hypothetical protein